MDPNFGRRGTLAGTLNYMAPEMLDGQQTTLATDVWALGNMMFKMATGSVPFKGTELHVVKQKACSCVFEWPQNMEVDPDLKDFIERIIVPDPMKRFGAPGTSHDINAMKKHPFFKGIDWSKDLAKQINMKQLLRDTEGH